jgi:hypothetical protein
LGRKWAYESADDFHENGQRLVTEVDNFIQSTILDLAEQYLGSYDIVTEKQRPTGTLDYLHRSGRGSASLRLYKRSLRSSGETSSSIIISRDPNLKPEEDCLAFFKEVYGNRPGMMESISPTSPESIERREMIQEWLDSSAWNTSLSVEEIQIALKTYPIAKARGIDGISPVLLKKLDKDEKISSALHILFNACIFFGQTPQSWNHALITTIPKDVNDSSTVDKRRPISVTPMIRRTFEKAYLQKLDSSIDGSFGPRNYDFYPGQAGFRKHYSTYSNAIAIHEAVVRGDRQVAFVDLKQAYDRVDVERLLVKLKTEKVCSRFRNLVRSLYTGGVGSIIVNGTISESFDKYSGLMQGGLWSPVLFSFYVDDMSNDFLDSGNQFTIPLKLFADDVAIVRPGKEITPQLHRDIASIEKWCCENSMAMNAKKSAILDSAKVQEGEEIRLSDGSQLPIVPSYKYLGFPFTKNGLNLVELLNIGIRKGQESLTRAKLKGYTHLYSLSMGVWSPAYLSSIDQQPDKRA